jgi:lambda family phage portal protein
MNILDRVIAGVSPEAGLRRARARVALGALMHYDTATRGNRASSWRPVRSDADGAAERDRARLAFVARDMVRNTAFALRAQQVISGNVVGDGIIPKVASKTKSRQAAALDIVTRHFDTVNIDANGLQNLYGLQRLIMNAVVETGEVLIRKRRRSSSDGLPLPFQIEVIEADFLATEKDGALENGWIREGIEYDAIGRRVAYWLYAEHPGTTVRSRMRTTVRRISASEILHIFRQDRPGQMRGVSWFAPIGLLMQDMADFQDAQVTRQKIAACFAGFRTMTDGDPPEKAEERKSSSLVPGRIEVLQPGESITFSRPPPADGIKDFASHVYRSVAAGMGVTYEALTGDYSNVNFSSARMGRSEMGRNVSAWQWLMIIPQFLNRLADWTLEAMALQQPTLAKGVTITWVPPMRELVDPIREISALVAKIKAGLASRQSVIRELGFDPERVIEEIQKDQELADSLGLVFETDVGGKALAQPGQSAPTKSDDEDDDTGSRPAKKGNDDEQE